MPGAVDGLWRLGLDFLTMESTMEDWRSFTEEAIQRAKRAGASYADIRVYPEDRFEEVETENGEVVAVNTGTHAGFGVRVLCDGAWGFYATDTLDKAEIAKVVERAVANARANAATRKHPVELLSLSDGERGKEHRYTSKYETDPFSIAVDKKVELLLRADRAMAEVSKRVFLRKGHINSRRFRKILFTSDNVFADQTFMRVGASVTATAERDHADPDKQTCSHPSHFPSVMQKGWEAVLDFDLVGNAGRVAEEADRFLDAPETPTGVRDIILMPEQNNLHATHETVHGAEGDRVDDKEWSLSGGSLFSLVLPEIGSFRFGSDAVSIVADSLTEGGVGTFACDDEGIPAKRTVLVDCGIWKGLLVSRESAPSLNRKLGKNYFTEASGAMRASSYASFPLIRMNNISLLPGEISYEEMLDRVPVGTIRFGNNKSWSIDPYRRDFQFGTETGWEKVMRNGKVVWEPRRNPVYRGDNLKQFFRNCVTPADAKSALLLGVGNCGKGRPVQTMATGHCTPPTWYKNINVDSSRSATAKK